MHFLTYFLWACAACGLCLGCFINTDMLPVENDRIRYFLTFASVWIAVSGFLFGIYTL